MKRYYKVVENGYILTIGIGDGGQSVSQNEYEAILDVIRHRPMAEEGYDCRLKENLTWELYKLPEEAEG